MDGYQMTREIRKDDRLKDIPIILLTAKSGEEGLEEGFLSGANDYLSKPFSPSELKLRIRNHLLLRKLLDDEKMRYQNLASVGTLSAGISHNMNTYAATVDCGLVLLTRLLNRRSWWNPEIEAAFQSADEGLQSIRSMIENLAVYSQKNVEGFRNEDLVKTTSSVVELARAKLPNHVKLDFKAPDILRCYFNPHILNPALMNLIDNAAEACQAKSSGRVEVCVTDAGGSVSLTVKDNGSGISHQIQSRIWEPYFTTKGMRHGTGLGLWMVRRAVELNHRGQVWFETGTDGTTFFINLPTEGKKDEREKEKNSAH
jgi:two-component system sensor histidine kinase/response regulator